MAGLAGKLLMIIIKINDILFKNIVKDWQVWPPNYL